MDKSEISEIIEHGEEIESRQVKNGVDVWYKHEDAEYKVSFDSAGHPVQIQTVGEYDVQVLD
jgi:hypothetical protein